MEQLGPTPTEIKGLKEANPSVNLHQSRLKIPKDGGNPVVVWREPTHAEYEMFSSASAQRSEAWIAYRNLLVTLVVWPTLDRVRADLFPKPLSIQKWADDEVLPFFGLGTEIETTPL